MGAKITGHGSPRITIQGVKKLSGADWDVIPDRIETATFLIAAAATRSKLTVTGGRPDHLLSVLDVLRQMGVGIERSGRSMTVIPAETYKAAEVTTLPYPAFPTDVQSPIMTLMAMAAGTSILTERIYPDRFMTAAELRRMGATISVANGQAVIQGVAKLKAAPVMASDLRAGAALTIAALAADGETRLSRVYHIDRGYERFEERLRKLGARIERVRDEVPETAAAAGG